MDLNIALYAVGVYGFVFLCWVLYLAVMSLSEHRDEMGWIAKGHAMALLAIAYPLDLVLNVVVGTVIFAALPREFTLTTRLKRHQREGGWRGKLAAWICKNLLNAFARDGGHC